ncbi:hypothetical protein FA95DRAFT_991443 [Auriscalpium vulgare]|uniref:Uncharacterized protein n=1 Tax=Auriscalpium vulgare TaxID=40419 RepID=A0ACB8R6U6_9AGAM|nr:hypothetical protein FA95DRAFT_991443 [Auriscalpium vulgare]
MATNGTHEVYYVNSFQNLPIKPNPNSRFLYPRDLPSTSARHKPPDIAVSTRGCTVQSGDVYWTIGLVDLGPVDVHDEGKRKKHHFVLLCDDRTNPGGVSYMWDVIGVGMPPASIVVDYVRGAIAAWVPRPIPPSLRFCAAFTPYVIDLANALEPLPAGITYEVNVPAMARMNSTMLATMAESYKKAGNAAFAARNRDAALSSYDMAVDSLAITLVLGYGDAEMLRVRTLLAVSLANRAAAHMLDGPGMDAESALRDGLAAERKDPGYVKGYLRQMRAHLALGDAVQARSALERASKRAQGADVQIVADALAALPKSD